MNRDSLHPFQTRAIDFVTSKRRAALWLFLGAGKTIITLSAINDLLNASIIKKVLIIAPLRVARSVWKQEAAKWDHLSELRVSVATGTAKERKAALAVDADIYVTNKENTKWIVEQFSKTKHWPFDAVVLDEASAFKSQATQRFRALRKVVPHTTVFIELTGTPAANSLMDVWSQVYLLDSGASLGKTITGYRQRFFTADYFGYSWDIKPGSAEKIQTLIKPLILSMQGSEYIELPERIDIIEKIVLPAKIKKLYDDFSKELFLEFEGVELEALSAAVLANKLLQMSSGAIYHNEEHDWTLVHNCKLDALSELIEENPNENILLAYGYVHSLKRILTRFPEAVVLDKDPKTIDRWNAGGIKLLVAHPQSAAHGLNLQSGGSMLVWMDLPWSLEGYSQLCGRLHRQGQEKPVRIVHLVCEGTIDQKVISVLGKKGAVQADLLEALR